MQSVSSKRRAKKAGGRRADEEVFVGLDYHAQSIQVCVVDSAGSILANRRCGNSVTEVIELASALGSPRRVAIEACCGGADFAEELAQQTGWLVSLAHPGYVSRMKRNPDKSDFSDARMLAELCRVGMIPEVWLAPRAIRELRLLVRLRYDLVKRRTALKLRILAVLREQRIASPPQMKRRWTLQWVAWLRSSAALTDAGRRVVTRHLAELEYLHTELKATEQDLAELTVDDPVVAQLRTIREIGPVTAWTMRALIGRFDRFRCGKQLSRFCGLTPRNASSGKRQADSGLIRAGDPALKTCLIQAAQRLWRHDPRWRAMYDKLRGEGRPATVAIAAIANRWVRSLHHQLKEIHA